jgi:uncharacterized membrane protein
VAGDERRRPRIDQPRESRRALKRPQLDPEFFGRTSESIARFFGTARYLAFQTVLVIIWILLNILQITQTIRWDPYPFILLNLAFSTQAAYAAPLILLAQNRQADRDRVQAEADRARDERNIANTEYLSREIAALRIAMGEVATRDFVRSELQAMLKELEERREAGTMLAGNRPDAGAEG